LKNRGRGGLNRCSADQGYCLHVTLGRRLHALAPGLTPRSVLENFAAMQLIDVHLPTTDSRELLLTRYTEPELKWLMNAEKGKPMLVVDAQIHLWEKGTPSAHHRQEPYSAEQAMAGMDAAGVGRALIHPVLWDPDSNELAVEAAHKYPDRFAIMGWFYLDHPDGRDLVAHWKERPGMLGLRFYTNDRHPQFLVHRRHSRLAMGRRRARRSADLVGAAIFLPTVGKIAERHPGLKLIVDHMASSTTWRCPAPTRARRPIAYNRNCWNWLNTRTWRSRRFWPIYKMQTVVYIL
jgi:hypothetical protein